MVNFFLKVSFVDREVMIVNGEYRGSEGILKSVNMEKLNGTVVITSVSELHPYIWFPRFYLISVPHYYYCYYYYEPYDKFLGFFALGNLQWTNSSGISFWRLQQTTYKLAKSTPVCKHLYFSAFVFVNNKFLKPTMVIYHVRNYNLCVFTFRVLLES